VSGPVRAFIALEIPDGVRSRIAAACDELRSGLPAARWTRPQSWHLTLKFLGEAPPEVLAALTASLEPAVKGLGSVSARLHGSGFFPSPANPRVAWIGGDVAGAAEVVAAVEEAAAAAGFAREKRPWSLHLTLARLRSRWPRAAVDRFLEWGGGLSLEGFACEELVLFQSSLEPGGAVYTPLQRIPLV
jgi:2'-5' RNA ligase